MHLLLALHIAASMITFIVMLSQLSHEYELNFFGSVLILLLSPALMMFLYVSFIYGCIDRLIKFFKK